MKILQGVILAAMLAAPVACNGRPALDAHGSTPPVSSTGGAAGADTQVSTPPASSAAGAAGSAASGEGIGGSPDSGPVAPASSGPPVSQPQPQPAPASPSCGATCSTPSALGALASSDDVADALVGRWQICAGADEWRNWAPTDTVGFEFTAPNGVGPIGDSDPSGDFYYLVAGPDGAPTRGADEAHHLRYDIPSARQVNLTRADGGSFYASPRASSCPRQLELHLMYTEEATQEVPLLDGDRPASLVPPPCTSTTAASPAMPVETFCQIYAADCRDTGRPGYWWFDSCVTSYSSADPARQTCQSYHLCNADHILGSPRELHCDHAAGLGVCSQ
jgi:hypothetical protein